VLQKHCSLFCESKKFKLSGFLSFENSHVKWSSIKFRNVYYIFFVFSIRNLVYLKQYFTRERIYPGAYIKPAGLLIGYFLIFTKSLVDLFQFSQFLLEI